MCKQDAGRCGTHAAQEQLPPSRCRTEEGDKQRVYLSTRLSASFSESCLQPPLPVLQTSAEQSSNLDFVASLPQGNDSPSAMMQDTCNNSSPDLLFSTEHHHTECTGMLLAPVLTGRPAAPWTSAKRAAWHDHEQHCLACPRGQRAVDGGARHLRWSLSGSWRRRP